MTTAWTFTRDAATTPFGRDVRSAVADFDNRHMGRSTMSAPVSANDLQRIKDWADQAGTRAGRLAAYLIHLGLELVESDPGVLLDMKGETDLDRLTPEAGAALLLASFLALSGRHVMVASLRRLGVVIPTSGPRAVAYMASARMTPSRLVGPRTAYALPDDPEKLVASWPVGSESVATASRYIAGCDDPLFALKVMSAGARRLPGDHPVAKVLLAAAKDAARQAIESA